MDKYDFITFFKNVADEMNAYQSIRAGGNLGTSIQGYLQMKGSEKIAESNFEIAKQLGRLADVLQAREIVIKKK